ncbi:MAG: BMP family ABC transporter substrate-binding protein, partial [Clostridia bacterium]|nr:BMP family ABC transporter substrate-binding protein [Clostridia bacterium]
AYTYAEVMSGYTSFFLGARSVCPTATMDVIFTGSWYDEAAEKEAANNLIASGCKLISQHADSMGAPTACEAAGVPDVSYNGSTLAAGPNTFIISSAINWAPYMEFIINSVKNGTEIPADWCKGLDAGSVVLSEINEAVAAKGTKEAIETAKAALTNGTLHVFDINTFTVNGAKLTDEHLADVDTDENYTPDTKVVYDGYFHESEKRSAPYFDLRIDGIKLVNEKY